jgi:hypothetical protein
VEFPAPWFPSDAVVAALAGVATVNAAVATASTEPAARAEVQGIEKSPLSFGFLLGPRRIPGPPPDRALGYVATPTLGLVAF